MNFLDEFLEAYIENHTTPESQVLKEVIRASENSLEYTDTISGRQVGRLLQMLVRLCGCRGVLEVGTFTGDSAVSIADALPAAGELNTLDANALCGRMSAPLVAREPSTRKIGPIAGFA